MRKFKNALLTLSIMAFAAILTSSCKKANNSFDGYFYLSQPMNESSAVLNIDGTNYGAILYIAAPVTEQSAGLNHVKLPQGRHNIIVYDGSNNAIMSSYISVADNSSGAGSWGPAGGGENCSGSGSGTDMLVGLFK